MLARTQRRTAGWVVVGLGLAVLAVLAVLAGCAGSQPTAPGLGSRDTPRTRPGQSPTTTRTRFCRPVASEAGSAPSGSGCAPDRSSAQSR